MKKYLLLTLLVLTSCSVQENELSPTVSTKVLSETSASSETSEFHASFEDGKLNFLLPAEEGLYDVYEEKRGGGDSVPTAYGVSSFESADYDSVFRFVPCSGGEAITYDYVSECFPDKNIHVFSPKDSHEEIQNFISSTYSRLQTDEWSQERQALLFLPGDYSDIDVEIPYYVTVHGLGKRPTDVVFSSLQCHNNPNTRNALINFWRSAENVSFMNASVFAASQAASLRRLAFHSSLCLADATEGEENTSSGGFLADSFVYSTMNARSQQQYLFRNCEFGTYQGGNFNMVFEGSTGIIENQGNFYNWPHITTLTDSTAMKEKPFLCFDEKKGFGIAVPEVIASSRGITWAGEENLSFLPLTEFHVALESENASELNAHLEKGENILFSPGIYHLDEPLCVTHSGLLLGLGMATLSGSTGNEESILNVQNPQETDVCSLLFETEGNIQNYIRVGDVPHSEGKTCLYDIFCRVGGDNESTVSVRKAVVINQDDLVLDHAWIWRADHGHQGRTYISRELNYGGTGIEINGDRVNAHALMVEHFYEEQTVWNGNSGRLVFYQSETPYDLHRQDEWERENPYREGRASIYLGENVTQHEEYGIGIYFTNLYTDEETEKIFSENAIEIASSSEEIVIHSAVFRHFCGGGGWRHGINATSNREEKTSSGISMTYQEYIHGTVPIII